MAPRASEIPRMQPLVCDLMVLAPQAHCEFDHQFDHQPKVTSPRAHCGSQEAHHIRDTPAPDTSKHATLRASMQLQASAGHSLDIKRGVPWISQMCRWHSRRPQSCTFWKETTPPSMTHPTCSRERNRVRVLSSTLRYCPTVAPYALPGSETLPGVGVFGCRVQGSPTATCPPQQP